MTSTDPTGRHLGSPGQRYGRRSPAVRTALGRRGFLTLTTTAAALAFATGLPGTGTASAAELDGAQIGEDPFSLGVASGDPLPDSVILWTRLAPEPYEPGGGLGARRVTVRWEVAGDRRFRRVLAQGTTSAHPEFNHSVHVDVRGLTPDRFYYYRFRTGPWVSETGRTRTAPAHTADPARMSLAAVSCQAYHDGYYTAYRHLAEDDVALVLHLGDYLYEYAVNSRGGARNYPEGTLPSVFDRETMTLEDYRLRYALYKSDADLRAAHAAHPFVVAWDDHETENDYAGAIDEKNDPPEEFLPRRAAAYRAYWENQPVRLAGPPTGPDMRLYRRLRWGTLAQFDVLDTRQYRSDQAYGDQRHAAGPETDDPARTITGDVQERWLIDGWRGSSALWNVVPQQVCFSQRRLTDAGADSELGMDGWDGYRASRARVLAGARAAGVENLMVLTGDLHSAHAFDIKADFDDPGSATVGTELVATSISSGKDGTERPGNWDTFMTANPHMKLYDGRRGYVRVTLGRGAAYADFRTVDVVTTPGSPVATTASFVVDAGSPGLEPA